MLGLALLLISSGPGLSVEIEEASRIPMESARQLAGELARAIEARTLRSVKVEDPVWSADCPGEHCSATARSHDPSRERVAIRIHQGLTQVRVIAARGSSADPSASPAVDLDLEARSWSSGLAPLAAALFPMAAAKLDLAAPAPPPRVARTLLPWVAIAGGVALSAVGVGFAISASSARRDLDGVPHTLDEADALNQKFDRARVGAGIAFGASALALALGGLLFATD